jgi:REP element-mobilizing transposase RayT
MRYKRVQIPGATYFFTVNLANRANRLLMDHIDIHRQSMQQTKQHHPFSIDAIVILPDHFHTIWILPKYDSVYSKRCIKNGVLHWIFNLKRSLVRLETWVGGLRSSLQAPTFGSPAYKLFRRSIATT